MSKKVVGESKSKKPQAATKPTANKQRTAETDPRMAEPTSDANAYLLKLQMKMQDENQKFTSVSNVLKTKHDTAKNSISNIR